MAKVAIVTDSNSGISQKKAEGYGIFVLPLSFNISGVDYQEGVDLTHNEFFILQTSGAKIFTSQPAPGAIMDLWEEILETYDEIVHIPMAGGLSSSLSTATALADDYDGKVVVVDTQRVSVTQKQCVLDAKALADQGKSAKEIRKALTFAKSDASIYMMVDDLKYLKAGGRISPAAAAMGSVLNIKPILSVNDGCIDAVDKVRGKKAAMKKIFENLEKDMDLKFHDMDITHYRVYTAAALPKDEAIAWNQTVMEHFGVFSQIEAIPLSVCTHVGIGTFGAALCKKMDWEIELLKEEDAKAEITVEVVE